MNEAGVEEAVASVTRIKEAISVPLIVENSPVYFTYSADTMKQSLFIRSVVERAGIGLLLDLAHLRVHVSQLRS